MIRNVLIAILVIVVVGVCAAYLVVRNGLAADQAPNAVETAVARRLVRLSIPSSERALTNPNAAQGDAWKEGEDHFSDHCAGCHGSDGRGDSEFGQQMYPPVPNLTSADIQHFSDGELFAIIQHGVRWTGMPAFESEHTADETWNLVSFVRHLPSTPADTEHHEHEHGHQPEHEHTHAQASAAGRTIAMDGTTFTPNELTVKVGDTVTFTNKDPFPHNIASAAAGMKSGDVESDAQWQFRPTKPGRFSYVCTLHPGMKGTLVVQP